MAISASIPSSIFNMNTNEFNEAAKTPRAERLQRRQEAKKRKMLTDSADIEEIDRARLKIANGSFSGHFKNSTKNGESILIWKGPNSTCYECGLKSQASYDDLGIDKLQLGDLGIDETGTDVKFVVKEIKTKTKADVRNALMEIEITKDCAGRFVIPIAHHSYENNTGIIRIVTPKVDGDLSDPIGVGQENALPLEIARDCLRQCLEATQYVYTLNYVHNDIKADNFFLIELPNGFFRIILADFGYAKKIIPGSKAILGKGEEAGTEWFGPKELLNGKGYRSDLTDRMMRYGVAKTFCLCCLGYDAYEVPPGKKKKECIPPKESSLQGRMKAFLRDERFDPDIIIDMLSDNPEKRPTYEEILADPIVPGAPSPRSS